MPPSLALIHETPAHSSVYADNSLGPDSALGELWAPRSIVLALGSLPSKSTFTFEQEITCAFASE